MILNALQSPNKHVTRLIIQIAQYYDKILIHTPQNMENSYFLNHIPSKILRDQCQQLLKSLVKKIVYTGYVLPYQPQPTPGREELVKKKPNITTVLVTRGGGAVAPRIILTAIRAQTLLGENYRFIIACGPATSPREIQLFKNILKKSPSSRILLIQNIPDLTYFLSRSDIAVATCGYNTAVQIMQTGIPSILLPYISPTSYTGDQYPRAKLMNDLLGAPILNFQDLTPSQLAEAIKKQTHRNKNPMPRHWFNGRKKAADFILKNLP
jgi:predicted glycosyltransferase